MCIIPLSVLFWRISPCRCPTLLWQVGIFRRKIWLCRGRSSSSLALDYHVRSRTNEVDAVASAEVTNLNGDTSVFNAAVKVWRVRWWYFQQVTWKTTKLPYSQSRIKDYSIWEASEKCSFPNLSLFFISLTLCLAFLSFFTPFIFSFSIRCVQKGLLLKLNFLYEVFPDINKDYSLS